MIDWVIELSMFCFKQFKAVWLIAFFLGFWMITTQIYRGLHFFYAKIIRKRINFNQRYGPNRWALITGSSEGIGKAFARALAKESFNILLSARTQQKLKKFQDQLLSQFPDIQVRYIVVDFISSCEKQIIEQDWYKNNNLQKLDICIVVNNAGIDYLGKLNDLSLKDIIRLIQLDCYAVNSLMYSFLNRWMMRLSSDYSQLSIFIFDKEAQQHYLMINVSSLCAEMPISYFSVYNAAKIYVDRLAQACALQYPEIDLMVLRPSEVSTKMTGFKKDIFTIEPEQCVQSLLDDIGYQTTSNGHITHAVQSWFYKIVPFWLFNLLWERIFVKQFKQVRVKFQQKEKLS